MHSIREFNSAALLLWLFIGSRRTFRSAFILLDNENLEELWDWSTREKDIRIENGRLAFYLNPKLCFKKIQEFNEIAKMQEFTPEEVPPESNGDKVACKSGSFPGKTFGIFRGKKQMIML